MSGCRRVGLGVLAVLMLAGGTAHGGPKQAPPRLRMPGVVQRIVGSRCACPPVTRPPCAKGRHLSCPLRLWLGCSRLFGRRRLFALSATRSPALRVDRRIRKLRQKAYNPLTGAQSPSLLRLAGFQAELDLGVFMQSQRFADGLVNTYDHNQATHGQFVVTYRRALFPGGRSWLEKRMALVVYAYKLGVDTPLLRQLFTGGWLALEWSLFPYRRKLPGRLLLRVASLGGHTELARDNITGKKRILFYLNAALSVEASYTYGPVTAVLTSTAMPRYDEQSFGTRVESSLALRVRLVRRTVAHAWLSEITLEPKVTHYYHSFPLLEEVRSAELTEELQQRVRTYGWSDLRHIVTAYCNIRFRLRL